MASIDAQAAPADKPLAIASFNIRIPGVAIVISIFAIAALARLLLASIDGFGVDMGTFRGWSGRLANDGPWNFYSEDFFSDYAPGYMYVLWLMGELDQIFHFNQEQFEYILKLPSIVADLAGAFLLYKMLDKEKSWVQLLATTVYLLFPAALLVGAFWGQVDSILSFFLLLSVYFIGRDRPVAGAVAFAVGFIIKPQAIAALPFLAYWIIKRHPVRINFKNLNEFRIPRVLVECTAYPLLVIFLLILPFFTTQPWDLFEQLRSATTVDNYEVNSFWAYNLWTAGGLFEGGFRCDLQSACSEGVVATQWLGIDTRYWGFLFFGIAIASLIYMLRDAKGNGFLAFGTGLSVMAFYMLTTRMHERYIFPAFLPLLLGVALLHSRVLWAAFIATAVIHFLNLYHVFSYYYLFAPNEMQNYPGWTQFDWLYNDFLAKSDLFGFKVPLLGTGFENRLETVQFLAIIFLVSFLAMFPAAYMLAEQQRHKEKPLEGV